ncbi:hypothetical protein [Actinoplanes sp. NPDC051494]|uniref:hypothetical protein n=1 Tax=Actinoplanes sp. NPDC051494 TaxID=3363907 RepID=UPI00378EE307
MAVLLTLAAALAWTGPAPCGLPMDVPGPGARPPTQKAVTDALPGDTSGAAGTVSTAHSTNPPEPVDRPPVRDSPPPFGTAPGSAADTLPPPPGTVGVPVRLSEPAALLLLRVRDRVDLFRPSDSGHPIASAVLVLGITNTDDPLVGGLLLALPPDAARTAIEQSPDGYAVTIRPSG